MVSHSRNVLLSVAAIGIGMILSSSVSAQVVVSGSAFNFTVKFDNISAGTRLNAAEMPKVFTDSHITRTDNLDNGDANHVLNTIVSNDCKSGNCLQFKYPKGTLGQCCVAGYGILGFILRFTPVSVINVEYDWKFELGFDLHDTGKIGPWLAYNPWSLHNGSDILLIWRNINGVVYWYPCTQDPANGNTICINNNSPVSGPTLKAGQWHHIKMQLVQGSPSQEVWIDGVLIWNHGQFTPANSTGLIPMVSFRSWFGGAGQTQAAQRDSYAHIDNVHIWSGTGNLISTQPLVSPASDAGALSCCPVRDLPTPGAKWNPPTS